MARPEERWCAEGRLVVRTMPPGKAGSLTEEQYFAILAFDLEANGARLEQRLDAPLAKTLVIPR